jgi:hypothetical protein
MDLLPTSSSGRTAAKMLLAHPRMMIKDKDFMVECYEAGDQENKNALLVVV